MKQHIVVREYARLSIGLPGAGVMPVLDHGYVSASAFTYLCKLMSTFRKSGATLFQLESQTCLKLDNYVGILSTPCGTVIEILPKHTEDASDAARDSSRQILIKMLCVALELPARSAAQAALQSRRLPLQEWVMQQFVHELDLLVKRGLRFDYQLEQSEQRFLRGQLDVAKQMRQSPARRHLFPQRHDVFLPDNAENRLLKSALMIVCDHTRDSTTWRDAHALAGLFADITGSRDVANDLRAWRKTRLMSHYNAVRPWCELALGQHMPVAHAGATQGLSLLFPMERLFERYVEHHLQARMVGTDYRIKRQAASQYLCKYDKRDLFLLKPDMLLKQGEKICMVLDVKWKLLSNQAQSNKYGLQQSDFYQMFAYGYKYLAGVGEMMLIYPTTPDFTGCMGRFEYAPGLGLRVAGFDLENDNMVLPQEYLPN